MEQQIKKLTLKFILFLSVATLSFSCAAKKKSVSVIEKNDSQISKESNLDYSKPLTEKKRKNLLEKWLERKTKETGLEIVAKENLEKQTEIFAGLEQGFNAFVNEDFDYSIDLFEKSLIQLGTNFSEDKETVSRAYNSLGNSYYQKRYIAEALEVYQIAILLKSDFSEAYNNVGLMNFILRDYENAKIYFKKSIELKPGYRIAMLNLRVTDKILDKSLNLDSMELLKTDISKKELPSQIKFYNLILSIDSTYHFAYNNLAVCYFLDSEHEKAIENLETAIGIEPNFAEAYNNLGYINSAKENYPEAKKLFLKAISLKVGYKEAYNNLAYTYYKLGDLASAKAFWKAVLDYDPSDKDALDGLRSLRTTRKNTGRF
ncbi:MAG: tetratricopeptide repeat protein [Calditrichaeota bacterium]|nr:MAG: tetratricopeptide repeat protein [Calditrichota bacterium]